MHSRTREDVVAAGGGHQKPFNQFLDLTSSHSRFVRDLLPPTRVRAGNYQRITPPHRLNHYQGSSARSNEKEQHPEALHLHHSQGQAQITQSIRSFHHVLQTLQHRVNAAKDIGMYMSRYLRSVVALMSPITNGWWDLSIRVLDKTGFWDEEGLLWMMCGFRGLSY